MRISLRLKVVIFGQEQEHKQEQNHLPYAVCHFSFVISNRRQQGCFTMRNKESEMANGKRQTFLVPTPAPTPFYSNLRHSPS